MRLGVFAMSWPAGEFGWIVAGMRSPPPREGKKRPCVDGW